MAFPAPSQAVQRFYPYTWCQVREVFAKELVRASQGSMGWLDAYREADQIINAIRMGLGDDAALGQGARPGEASWPDVACLAWSYASLPPNGRSRVRNALAFGQVPAALAADPCPREVAFDSAYLSAPSCNFSRVRDPKLIGLVGAVFGVLLGWTVLATRKP